MSERILIKDFGPLQNVDLTLKDIAVFIGPQASGKSTLAKLIHFCRYITGDEPFLSAEPDQLLPLFKKIFNEAYLQNSPQAEIEYTYNDNVKLVFKQNHLKYDTLTRRSRHRAVMVPAGRAVYSLVSQNLFSLMYENISIDPTILAFGKTIEWIKPRFSLDQLDQNLRELVTEILKGKLQIVENEERIYFDTGNKYVTLSQASSGQQEALPLLLILLDPNTIGENRYITLEEPEAHLYPYSQYKMVELIGRLYNRPNTAKKFVITTHSPYLLSSFNNLLFAYQVAHCSENAKQFGRRHFTNYQLA